MLFYLILMTLLLLLLLLKVQIEVKIIIKNGRNFSYFIIRFLGFIRLRMNLFLKKNKKGLPSLTFRKNSSSTNKNASLEQFWQTVREFFQFYEAHIEPLRYFKSKVKLDSFSIHSRIGTGDAASTAMTIGGCYAFVTFISRYLYQHYRLQISKLDIIPYFSGPLFDLDLNCIMNFKFGHIIIAGLKLLSKKEKAVS